MSENEMLKFGDLKEIQYLCIAIPEDVWFVLAAHSGSDQTFSRAIDIVGSDDEEDRFEVETAINEIGEAVQFNKPTPSFISALNTISNHAEYFKKISEALERQLKILGGSNESE